MNFTQSKPQSGFTFVEVLIALVVTGMMLMAAASIYSALDSHQQKAGTKLMLQLLREKLIESLRLDLTWSQTLADPLNTSFECLKNPATYADCPAEGAPFALKNPELGLTYDPVSNEGHGLTRDGEFCTTFPSAECPMRLKLSWAPVCLSNCASHPMIKLEVKFESSSWANYNLAPFGISVVRSFQPASIANAPVDLSFEHAIYTFFEDEAASTNYQVKISYAPQVPITFDLCLEKVTYASACGFVDAKVSEDITTYKCHAHTIPAGAMSYSLPSYAFDSAYVPSKPGCTIYGVAFSMALKNISNAIPGSISRANVYVYDKTSRLVLNDLRLDGAGAVTIDFTNPGPGTSAILRNEKNEPVCRVSIASGASSVKCPSTDLTMPVSGGSKMRLCRSTSSYILCTDFVILH